MKSKYLCLENFSYAFFSRTEVSIKTTVADIKSFLCVYVRKLMVHLNVVENLICLFHLMARLQIKFLGQKEVWKG